MLKENHLNSNNILEEKPTSQKIIKKNYIAPEVKSAPEKDKQKIYFPESRVGPARKVIEKISISKSDALLIFHTLTHL
jgi:hypothetical protein